MKAALFAILASIFAFGWLKLKNTGSVKLSENFKLGEFLKTSTGLFNSPGTDELENLTLLAEKVLQPLRNRIGRMKITSGYRSQQVNEAVGGSQTSDHLSGLAADFVPLDTSIENAWNVLKGLNLPIKQAIFEDKKGVKWIHVSVDKQSLKNPRKQFLTARFDDDQNKMVYDVA